MGVTPPCSACQLSEGGGVLAQLSPARPIPILALPLGSYDTLSNLFQLVGLRGARFHKVLHSYAYIYTGHIYTEKQSLFI